MKDNVKNTQVVVRFTESDGQSIEELADARGLTKAAWIRQLVRKAINAECAAQARGRT